MASSYIIDKIKKTDQACFADFNTSCSRPFKKGERSILIQGKDLYNKNMSQSLDYIKDLKKMKLPIGDIKTKRNEIIVDVKPGFRKSDYIITGMCIRYIWGDTTHGFEHVVHYYNKIKKLKGYTKVELLTISYILYVFKNATRVYNYNHSFCEGVCKVMKSFKVNEKKDYVNGFFKSRVSDINFEKKIKSWKYITERRIKLIYEKYKE